MTALGSDRFVVALAAVVVVAARAARPLPAVVVVAAAAAMALVRRPVLLLVAAAVVATTLGARSWEGVRSAPQAGMVSERVTLVSDPEWVRGGVRVEARRPTGQRVQVLATDGARAVVARALSGETVEVEGRLRPVSRGGREYLSRRHIGAQLQVGLAHDLRPGTAVTRLANQLRRTLAAGLASLPAERRALFTGIVLGDDRDQAPAQVDDFRAAGLSHLLAVSGQNVAFVLVVVAPLLRRLGLRSRFVVGCAVLATFGVLTRWEPSVLRAVAMAGLALLATVLGRPVSRVRVLALAVVGLVLLDPMLAGSIGFLLSVGACAGIAVVAPRLEARGVPAPVAVTLAAQVGVAPVLLPVFGPVPSASLPANLLAVPAAGPLMVWGLVAGLPAGLLGGGVATLLHVPTRLLLAWIAGVAAAAARWPLPDVGPVALAAASAATWLLLRRPRRSVVWAAVAVAVAVLLASSLVVDPPPEERGRSVAGGLALWRSGGATVAIVTGSVDEARAMEGLRRARVRRVDVLVVRSGGGGGARAAAAVRHRADVRAVIAPPGHLVPGAVAVTTGDRVRAGPLEVVVERAGPRLDVRVASTGHARDRPEGGVRAPRARPPPVRRDQPRPRDGHPQPHDGLVLRQGRLLRPRRPPAPGGAARHRRRRPPRRRRREGRAGAGGR